MEVLLGYQGAPEKLTRTDQLLTPVLAEAKMCGSGQQVIPSFAKSISDGGWIDLEVAFAAGSGETPTPTSQFQLDEGKGTRRDSVLVCPNALAATTSCSFLPDRWSPPHIAVLAEFSITAWDANVANMES